jgi:hypothetical protein
LDFEFVHKEFYIFPLILVIFYLIFLIFPFHCFYLRFRSELWIVLIRNIFPIGKTGVKFRDFIFGDVLTSLTKPFASLVLSFCLLSSRECKEKNTSFSCNRKTVSCLLIMLLPYIIRFFQCLNKLIYTKQNHHGANMAKYCFGFANVLFAWLYDNGKIKIKYN